MKHCSPGSVRGTARRLVFVLTETLALTVSASGVAAVPADRAVASPSWADVTAPAANSLTRQCANWSEWRVVVSLDGKGRVNAIKAPLQSASEGVPLLPFDVRSDVKGGHGRTLATRVADGFLVSFNHGEFGGSLWWYDSSGKSQQRIGDAHVVGFVEVQLRSAKVVAGFVESSSRLGKDSGSLAVVERATGGVLRIRRLAELGASPFAVSSPSARGTLVVTRTAVLRLSRDGTVRRLANVDFTSLYPGSVVETPRGQIVVGMLRYMVEIDQRVNPARVTWYTDAACRRFRPGERATCVCY
jgi:hypothetical protein